MFFLFVCEFLFFLKKNLFSMRYVSNWKKKKEKRSYVFSIVVLVFWFVKTTNVFFLVFCVCLVYCFVYFCLILHYYTFFYCFFGLLCVCVCFCFVVIEYVAKKVCKLKLFLVLFFSLFCFLLLILRFQFFCSCAIIFVRKNENSRTFISCA